MNRHKFRSHNALCRGFLVLLVTRLLSGAADEAIVEHSKPYIQQGPGLGTMAYPPTETEDRFLKKLSEREQVTGSMVDSAEYSIHGKVGDYVSWFGIVRSVTHMEKKVTRLLVEMKYFDGLTDLHLQIVSINGGGDFKALLSGADADIQRLSLVRIYGKVSDETDGVPGIAAEYVRVWPWGQFAFMEYGTDKSNPKWVELRKLEGREVYSSRPDRAYYEKLIGTRETK